MRRSAPGERELAPETIAKYPDRFLQDAPCAKIQTFVNNSRSPQPLGRSFPN